MRTPNRYRYTGLSVAERKERRRVALLEAALDVLAESGVEAITVRGVCRRAELNDRYFYEHFTSCDELLGALADYGLHARLLPDLGVRLTDAGSDPAKWARAATEATLSIVDDDPRWRHLIVNMTATPALRERRDNAVSLIAQLMQSAAEELLDQNDRQAQLTSIVLASGIFEVVVRWARGVLDIDRAQLADYLVDLLVGVGNIANQER
ncbi:TetR/AcrR family transcriptional regulator [Mycobacterium aquaticum]|jgi:AcrR family transcriptional regulator|uniref:HTH tetR-type domain-containing protein n=1 Tax=Mycobacterium aquaticum TaxID=1927124 RepID=A0A1X0AIP3_9MYCO|nr:TetR/AcrR family transcriptional regulator [Mycobacterium aquaticum]ORA29891.1 hypothetical protein BST13_26460 [Mycobacterium aquaticum]